MKHLYNLTDYSVFTKQYSFEEIIFPLTKLYPKKNQEKTCAYFYPTCLMSIWKLVRISNTNKAYLGPSVRWKKSDYLVKLSGGLPTEISSEIHSRRWYLGL